MAHRNISNQSSGSRFTVDRRIGPQFLSLFLSLLLASCGGGFVETSISGGDRVNAAGPSQVLQPYETIEKIDLVSLINAESGKAVSTTGQTVAAGKPKSIDEIRMELETAFANFYASDTSMLPERRNRIQDRILAASEQSCNVYQVYLQRLQSNANFVGGTLTTLLGGLSTIFTSEGVTRILAGSAAISGGIQSEFNQDFMFGELVPVITRGIEEKRKSVRNEIMSRRFKTPAEPAGQETQTQTRTLTPISEYSLQAAVVDAIRYHRACTITAALEEAAQSLGKVRNPGLQEAIRIQYMINDLDNAAAGKKPQFAAFYDPKSLNTPGAKDSHTAGSQSGGLGSYGQLPAKAMTQLVSAAEQMATAVKSDARRIASDSTDKRAALLNSAATSIAPKVDSAMSKVKEAIAALQCVDKKQKHSGSIEQAYFDYSAKPTPENRQVIMQTELDAYKAIGSHLEKLGGSFSVAVTKLQASVTAPFSDQYAQSLTAAIGGMDTFISSTSLVSCPQ